MPVEHKCHICHKVLTRSTILRDHLRSHKGDYAFECSVCGKAFVRNSDRKDHEETHTRQGKYVCRGTDDNGKTWGCGARFYRKYDLNRHKKRKGGAKCLLNSSPERLTVEESQSVDAALTLFDIASANTPSVGSLMMQSPLESEASTRSATTRSPLPASTPEGFSASIQRGHHSPGLPRPQRASESSIQSSDYILNLADPERPSSSSSRVQKHPATFKCNSCPKKFSRAYNLRSHLRTHTDERPFVCTVCGEAFARQHDRKRHEGLHSGEKRFVCKGEVPSKPGLTWGCGRRFAKADALGRHFRSEEGRVCIRPLLEEEATVRRTQAISTTPVDRGQNLSNPSEDGLAQLPYHDINTYLARQTYSEMNLEFPLTPEMLSNKNLDLSTFSWLDFIEV